ncbi:MAG: PEP-CTERM sorting domain-containing protein [Gemmataceae bacterium]
MTRAQRLCLLAVALGLAGSAGTADGGPIRWGYDWSASPGFVTAGAGKVTLSNETYHKAAGDSHVVATQLQVVSTASPQAPDTFATGGGGYSLTINLKDLDSGETGSLTFTGKLQGSFSQLSANVTNTFTSPTVQSLLLGFTSFVVVMDAYTPPGPPDQLNFGSIGAMVEVASLKPADNSPEPSAVALAGIGAGIAGLSAWRRRRKAA